MDQQNEGKNKSEMAEKMKLMETKLDSMEVKKPPKSTILRHGLSAELVDEMFACLPLEKAFVLLTGMPNCILARNVRKMLNSIKMAMNNNKWNAANHGPNLTISARGTEVNREFNSVPVFLPIPKFHSNIPAIAYFEVEILINNHPYGIVIGFCTQRFPLKRWFGSSQNSIRIWDKKGMWIDGSFTKFGNGGGYFRPGNVIGIGIIHSPENSPRIKCFATFNGKLLGMAKLPAKFTQLQLFPVAFLVNDGDIIRANFGQNEWRFNSSQLRK